jgi:DNA-binding transcriptional LysR family regulator
MDLNLLRVFHALWHERKVVAAAARLKLSAPALSNALARLRRATGDELFTRTPQGMQPTPYAEALAQTLVPALAGIEASLARSARFVPASSQRPFCIAMTDIGEIAFLPTLMHTLQQRVPGVTVRTVRNAPGSTQQQMARGDVDLAVGWLPALDAGFHQRRLFEQRYVCLMGSDHPLARGRLGLDRFVAARHALALAEGTGHERIEQLLRQQGIKRWVPLSLPDFVALPWILRESDLVAIVPYKLAQQVAEPLSLVQRKLPIALPGFEVNLFWHHRVHDDPAHRWMRALWAELFARPAR